MEKFGNINSEMETGNHLKKRGSLKSQMSKGNLLLITMFAILTVGVMSIMFFSCNDDNNDSKTTKRMDGQTVYGSAVMVMNENSISGKLDQIRDDGTVVFDDLAIEEIPEKGDIICAAPSTGAPQGFFYKVKNVTTASSKTLIFTEQATFEEAIKEANISKSFELKDYISGIIEGDGVTIENAYLKNRSTYAEGDISSGVKLTVDKTVKFNNNTSAVIKGTVEFKATFDCEMKFDDWTLQKLKLTTKPQFKAKLTAGFALSAKDSVTFNMAKFQTSPITILVGIVPLVINPEISIDAIVSINGEVKLQATLVELDYSKTYGCMYENGTFSKIKEDTSKPEKFLDDTQLELSGEVKLEPQLNFKFKIYNTESFLGVYGGFYSKLKLDDLKFGVDFIYGLEDVNPKLTLSCGISLGPEAKLELFSKKIGEWKPSFDVFTWIIWERNIFPKFSEIEIVQGGGMTSLHCNLEIIPFMFLVDRYGFCYGKNQYPTINDNHFEAEVQGGEAGAKELIDGIWVEYDGTYWIVGKEWINDYAFGINTIVYARPYFTNAFGTFYGKPHSFITKENQGGPVPDLPPG